jgi:hypothetical protein
MTCRRIISLAATTILGLASVSTDALAYRAGRVGVYHDGVYHGGAYRGAYVRRGVGVGIGTAAVGAAVATPYYYRNSTCGFYPNPPC